MKDIYVIIPSLDPEEDIMEKFINELHQEFNNILVVNDGSNKSHNHFFNSLEKKGIKVLKHYKNFGKGRALKNAFNYLLNEVPNIKGVVTCDCDGQHAVKDIVNVAKEVLLQPDKLILGVRNFDNDNVPSRSEYGNKITRGIFKKYIGLEITDTQTGLRGLSKALMEEFIELNGERYEYETNMLIDCKNKNIPLHEIEIETIYLNYNINSHFNPLKDSIRIYKRFSKYFIAAFTSYILDIFIFMQLLGSLKINSKILAATIIARIISSIYNYIVNTRTVLRHQKNNVRFKYSLLVFIQMFMSGCFVTYIDSLLNLPIILIKIVIDLIIWLINFNIERELVFKEN